jgi:hypothetical protein
MVYQVFTVSPEGGMNTPSPSGPQARPKPPGCMAPKHSAPLACRHWTVWVCHGDVLWPMGILVCVGVPTVLISFPQGEDEKPAGAFVLKA